jgi:hypothetical protein
MIGHALLAAALLALPTASAQSVPDTLDGVVTDLAYGYCPLFLAGQFPLTGNPKLTELGFTGAEQSAPNARFGSLKFVGQKRDGVDLSFGGVPDKVCQVNVIGAGAPAMLAKVRAKLNMLPYDFKPDTANSGRGANGASAETLMAKIDATTVMRVQFVQGSVQGSPIAGVQIFFMDQ